MNPIHKTTWTKRSQISSIMILCILILLLFGIVFYFSQNIQKKSMEQNLAKQQLSETEIIPLKKYILDCLDLSSRTGLFIAGKQGGIIYRSQGGSSLDYTKNDLGKNYLVYDKNNVPYAVVPAQGSIGTDIFSYQTEPPLYPWDGFPEYQPAKECSLDLETGADVCQPQPTPIFSTNALTGYNLLTHLPKLFTISMQEQLETYIQTKTLSCIDWSYFTTKNLKISKGDPNLSVVINTASTLVQLEYPINITNTATGAEAMIRTFVVDYPVRLGQLITYTSYLVDSDTSDLAFNITEKQIENITVERKPNIFGLDSILIAKDPHSNILDQPYELRFAIKNRPPALFLLNDSTHRKLNTFNICGSIHQDDYSAPKITIHNNQFCITNGAGCKPDQEICIPLQALDPDDNQVTFYYKIEYPTAIEYTQAETLIGKETLKWLQLQENPQAQMIQISIKASDGELDDWQDLRFNNHIEVT
ncbi:MAG: hypothetical protein AABX52_03580 [Nanoarchaeota archaeon]